MEKMNNPCEYCQYNGPYASIINPCENCPNSDFQVNVGFSPAETTKTTFYMTTTTDADVKTIHMNSNENNTGDAFVTGLSTELPTADEYRKSIGCPHYYQREWSEPKYICPKCGGGMCKNETMVFASNPPQYKYQCNKCGHVEYQLG
jgi:hypothetical protein